MRTDFPSVTPDTRAADVARLFIQHQVNGVPVLGTNGNLLGIVTDVDLVTKHAHIHMPVYIGILGGVIPFERRRTDEEIQRAIGVTAEDLMERQTHTVAPDATVEDVATLMVEEGAEPVAVVDRGRLVGLVSRRDVIRLVLAEEEDGNPSTTG